MHRFKCDNIANIEHEKYLCAHFISGDGSSISLYVQTRAALFFFLIIRSTTTIGIIDNPIYFRKYFTN